MKSVFFFTMLLCAVLRADSSLVNTAHLDFLYEEITVNGDSMGIIHIYSDFPYDKWTGDDDEGVACVDDAARAAVFYMKYNTYTEDQAALKKARALLKFLMYMQAENGFFYNFIWDDNSINKTFKTSVAEPNWWSWRAIWALAEGLDFFNKTDPEFSSKILGKLKRAIDSSLKWLPADKKYLNYGGFELPSWLPYETAADQSAILILGLTKYSSSTGDSSVNSAISALCDGVIKMQAGTDSVFPYGAFLSWQNTWHSWGNNQSNALINAGKLLNNPKYIRSAVREVEYFYPFLIADGGLSGFVIEKSGDSVAVKDSSKFPQIAYGIRPMVFAALSAYKITGEEKYAETAGELARWFFGKNPASAVMYSPETGRCFDGINNEHSINRNSGAESTVEALLAILEAEQNIISRPYLLHGIKD